jgi:excisionase family DNA binding protein
MEKLLYARLEAAQALGLSLRTIDQLIARKSLKIIRVGSRSMITRAELERFARNGTETIGEAFTIPKLHDDRR